MFAKLAVSFVTLATLATSVFAGPVALRSRNDLARRDFQSFNNWGGFSSMANFDNFYGVSDFDGSQYSQTVVQSQQEVVCHTEQITIIQQRLLVLQEMAKRIITEQVCDVETQTIVFEQWHSSLHGFSRDLRHLSNHQPGYDSHISGYYGYLSNSDGSLSTNDLGFSGSDLGKSTVVVSGSNWDQSHSTSVSDAYNAARSAYYALHPELL